MTESSPDAGAHRGEVGSGIFFIGYRGSGKSAVGELLANDLGWAFVDTDRLVEKSLGRSIARCFAEEGEPAFRVREREALEEVVERVRAGGRLVIATGGGMVLNPENVRLMRGSGRVVWLSARASVLRRRIGADPGTADARPALRGRSATGEIDEVLKERLPLYRAAAHHTIETDARSLRDVLSEAVERLRADGTLGSR